MKGETGTSNEEDDEDHDTIEEGATATAEEETVTVLVEEDASHSIAKNSLTASHEEEDTSVTLDTSNNVALEDTTKEDASKQMSVVNEKEGEEDLLQVISDHYTATGAAFTSTTPSLKALQDVVIGFADDKEEVKDLTIMVPPTSFANDTELKILAAASRQQSNQAYGQAAESSPGKIRVVQPPAGGTSEKFGVGIAVQEEEEKQEEEDNGDMNSVAVVAPFLEPPTVPGVTHVSSDPPPTTSRVSTGSRGSSQRTAPPGAYSLQPSGVTRLEFMDSSALGPANTSGHAAAPDGNGSSDDGLPPFDAETGCTSGRAGAILNGGDTTEDGEHQGGLIEARAVEDLVEVRAKPIEWWTPRKISSVIVGTLTVIAIIIAATTTAVLKNQNQKDGTTSEVDATAAPTLPPEERLRIIQDLIRQSYLDIIDANNVTSNMNNANSSTIQLDPTLLLLPGSPQYLASQWIALEDDYNVPVDNADNIIQRYALAVLYFATGGQSNWTSAFEFLQPEHECAWSGALVCGGGGSQVTGIQLAENNLVGQLPAELALLTSLNSLIFGANALVGALPPMMLHQLTYLDLSKNFFTGNIPDDYTSMTQLEHFHIHMNELNGTIPEHFGALTKLTSLDLEGNFLTGSIPDSMWDLSNMQTFIIETQRELTGTIADRVGKWSNVSVFLVNMLNGLTGTIPTEVGLLTKLVEFKVAQNHMRGPIPSEMGNLVNMKFLAFSRNGLNSTVPPELARMTNLHQLYIQSTWLSGDMDIFCSAMENGTMPKLTVLIADQGEVNCTCCTCCIYK